MVRQILFVAVLSLSAGAADAAAPRGSCADMAGRLQAYLQAHPHAVGVLKQTTGAQLMHQPTRESVEQARHKSRQDLEALLAKARAHQAAGDEAGCRADLKDVEWMLQP
jgi:hypothetical protein